MLSHLKIMMELNPKEKDQLASMMTSKVYEKNVNIISQGDISRTLFVIVKGRLKVYVNDEDGNQTILSFLNDGDYCGELSLLDGKPRSASILTLTRTEVMLLPYGKFKVFIDQYPDTAFSIFRGLTSHIRELDERVSILTSKDAYGRILHVLHKEAVEENGRIITPRFTHQEIAEMIGASREMVSRILGGLRKAGYINIENKRISLERKIPRH